MHTIARATATSLPIAAFVILASAITPRIAPSQHPLAPVRVEVPATVRDNARADTLEKRAEALYGKSRDWAAAARLHARAAALRGDDPRAIYSWRMAAWMYSAARDRRLARTMMERAAEHAVKSGDLDRGASSYIDAAFLAMEEGRTDRLPGLLRKTRVLLDAPLLQADRRAELLRRIEGAPRLAQALGTP